MKTFPRLLLFFLIFSSCNLLENLTKKNETVDFDQTNNIQKLNLDDLSADDKSKLDSLSSIYIESSEVIVNSEDNNLIDYILNDSKGDTIILSNLSVQTLTRGKTSSYNYDGKKNDVFSYEFQNNGSKKINSISLLEGEQIRFAYSNLRKKNKINGSFKVLEDNQIVLNIVNNGFFKSNLKVIIKQIANNYKTEVIKDSVIGYEKAFQKVTDTLYIIDQNKDYKISPYLDITNSTSLSIPINFKNDEKILAWGFWFSLNKEDLDSYIAITESNEEDPLILFAKSELGNKNRKNYLPITKNPFVETSLELVYDATPSLNSEKNFNFFIEDSLSLKKFNKGFLNFKNYSKLYDFDVNYKLLKVISRVRLVEVEVPILNNFIRIVKY